jgi:hypothetical protein
MSHASILFPMMALIGWTLSVLLLIPYQRFKAVLAGSVTVNDFKLGESGRVPGEVSIPNRNYMNLLEIPILFYVVCLTYFVAQKNDPVALTIAWSYVGTRVIHSFIHLSYNKVIHRLLAFAASNVILTVLWGRLLLQLAE